VIDPQNFDIVYAGTPFGVSKSTDGGASWSVAGAGLPASAVILVVIDPRNSNTLYALTLPMGVPGSPTFNVTLFKTTDGGETWSPAMSGLPPGIFAVTLAIDPKNPSTLYAGMVRAPFSPDPENTVYRSLDGGLSWTAADSGIPGCCVSALAIDPGDSNTIYAAWTSGQAARVGGIFKSADGGTTWIALDSDLAGGGVLTLAVDPQNPATLYALTSPGFLFLMSTNSGANWNTAKLPGWVQTFAIDPQNPATIYAAAIPSTGGAGGSGVFKTTDGGESWNAANAGIREMPVRNLAIDQQHSGTLYAANGGRVLKTVDGGTHWIASTLDVWKVVIDPQDSGTVFAVANDESSGQPAKSTDGGASWSRLNLPLTPHDRVTELAIDPRNPGIVYAGTAGEGVFESTNGGDSWSLASSGLPPDGVSVLAISGTEPTTVYASAKIDCDDGCEDLGDGIFKSIDGGFSWVDVNSGLPGENVVHGRSVFSIAIDPKNPDTLYIGLSWKEANNTYRGGLFKRTEGGTSWKQLSLGLPEGTYFGPLAIDPRNAGTVYVGTETGVMRSTDGGENWSAVNSGLAGISVTSLTIDSQDPNTVYAGTAAGLFVITFAP
jgi:photosystem II stability/assembly factor-like uncharacterized protein